jgi:hypothetical protein
VRWPFRRRSRGKHDLGTAVTGIPSLVRVVPVPEAPSPVAAPVAVPVEAPAPVAPSVVPAPPPGPRVELGFRDGTTAALAPGSEQAKALTHLASVLTQRD